MNKRKERWKIMKKVLIFLLIVGLLTAGAISVVQDVCVQITQENFELPNDYPIDSLDDGSTINGGGGGTGGGVPG
jgi:hypothetical protein